MAELVGWRGEQSAAPWVECGWRHAVSSPTAHRNDRVRHLFKQPPALSPLGESGWWRKAMSRISLVPRLLHLPVTCTLMHAWIRTCRYILAGLHVAVLHAQLLSWTHECTGGVRLYHPWRCHCREFVFFLDFCSFLPGFSDITQACAPILPRLCKLRWASCNLHTPSQPVPNQQGLSSLQMYLHAEHYKQQPACELPQSLHTLIEFPFVRAQAPNILSIFFLNTPTEALPLEELQTALGGIPLCPGENFVNEA